MSYLIYLKRSYMKRLKNHILLYIILTCAMILPLILSIYRDSIIHGDKSYIQEETRGYDYKVINAKEEYIEYFENIPGLSSYYEDDTIYIKIELEGDRNDILWELENSRFLSSIISEIQDEQLLLTSMLELGSEESKKQFSAQLIFVNMFIIIISLIIIQSAYKSYLKKFIADIGVLVSCGAHNKQIGKIFLIDSLIIYMASALSAIITSSVLMYLLFHNFLQVKDIANLSWIIFNINPYNVAVQLFIFAIAFFLMVLLSLKGYLKQSSIKMLHTDDSGIKLKNKKKTLKSGKSSVETLAKLLSQRTKSKVSSCLIITIPITIAVIFIFNYLIINIEYIRESPNYEITINKELYSPNDVGISTDDIAFVENVHGVRFVKEEFNISPSKYLIKDKRVKGNSNIELAGEPYADTKIQPYSNLENQLKIKAFNSNKYNIAISKNHEYIKYKVGDKISLYLNEMDLFNASVEQVMEGIPIRKLGELTVAEILDIEWTDRMFQIYVTDELYKELTKGESISRLNLRLDKAYDSKEIESILNDRFVSDEYSVWNNHDMFEKGKETSLGIYIMSLFIFGIMFAFILVILYVRLTDYVESQYKNIRIFHNLGGRESDLYKAYMRLPFNISMISIIISYVIGLGLSVLFFMNSGFHLIMNLTTVSGHIIIGILIFIAFNAPVHITMKNKLKKLDYRKRG